MPTAPFNIEQFHNCLLVTLRGKWDMATNILYLAQLSESLKRRRGRPFHLLVDMRTWQIPKSDSFNQMKAPIKLDRRNQLSEVWLENEDTDADHIADKFFSEQRFPLTRTKDEQTFLAHSKTLVDEVVMSYIRSWIENDTFR
jgi:hypothetical protein